MNINDYIFIVLGGVVVLLWACYMLAYFKTRKLERHVHVLELDVLNLRVFTDSASVNINKYFADCAGHAPFRTLQCRPVIEKFMLGIGAPGIPKAVGTFQDLYKYVKANGCDRPNFSIVFTWFSNAYAASSVWGSDRKVLRHMLVVLWLHFVVQYRKHPNFNLVRDAYMSRFNLDDDDLY